MIQNIPNDGRPSTTDDATDLATALTLVNNLKITINALINETINPLLAEMNDNQGRQNDTISMEGMSDG